MTRQKSFKRLVRARTEKTGESYTAARAPCWPPATSQADRGPPSSRSPTTVIRRPDRPRLGGVVRPARRVGRYRARSIARSLAGSARSRGRDGWCAQAMTVSYERARGMRAVGEKADGFSVTASKTVAVPVEQLFDAFVDESRRSSWLADGELLERTANRPRSARYDWGDGYTRVVVGFEAKGENKSTVGLDHERLPDADGGRADEAVLARAGGDLEGGAGAMSSARASKGAATAQPRGGVSVRCAATAFPRKRSFRQRLEPQRGYSPVNLPLVCRPAHDTAPREKR